VVNRPGWRRGSDRARRLEPWEHHGRRFIVASVVGGLGILLLLTLTSIAVLAWFARHPGHGPDRETRWRRIIAPGVASAALTVVSLATVVFLR
jgi:hypothetical protein